MLHIHPNARTTLITRAEITCAEITRAEIARSDEPSSVLVRRCGFSAETIRKWRKRAPSPIASSWPVAAQR